MIRYALMAGVAAIALTTTGALVGDMTVRNSFDKHNAVESDRKREVWAV